MIKTCVKLRTNRRRCWTFLALVVLLTSLNLRGQTILETQPEALPEQSRHKGWWPNNGSAPRSAYAGAQSCAPCHDTEFAGWQTTEMANALKPAAGSEFLRAHPHLSFEWGRYTYQIDLDREQAVYSVTDRTSTVSLPLLWAYGVGVVGQAFVFRDQGTYSEAEVAYYPQPGKLDVVAGVPRDPPATLQAAFGIPLVPMAARQCISCHTTAAVTNNRLQVESAILGVSCEACHGPGARHVAAMKAATSRSGLFKNPFALSFRGAEGDEESRSSFNFRASFLLLAALGVGMTRSRAIFQQTAKRAPTLIFNPASLGPADLEDFCGACHRTSLRVQNKGLHGLETVHYEPYRLELSSCWIMSQRITCLSCHNPHQPLARGASAYDAACLACHFSGTTKGTAGAGSAQSGKVCPIGKRECTTCHMPKCRIPLSPFSMSDHFIRIVSADDACGQSAGAVRAGTK